MDTFRIENVLYPCNVRSVPHVQHSYTLSSFVLWRANHVILNLIYYTISVNIYYAVQRTNCNTFSMCNNDLTIVYTDHKYTSHSPYYVTASLLNTIREKWSFVVNQFHTKETVMCECFSYIRVLCYCICVEKYFTWIKAVLLRVFIHSIQPTDVPSNVVASNVPGITLFLRNSKKVQWFKL